MAPWRRLPGDLSFSYRLERNDDGWSLFWTDLCRIWSEHLTEKEILNRGQELNIILLEAPVERLITCIETSLMKTGTVTVKNDDYEQQIIVLIKTKSAGFPFNWQFNLTAETPETVLKMITLPLLLTSKELILRQQRLFQILKRKDTEIEDYKTAGAKVSRRQLETAPFDEQAFLDQPNLVDARGDEDPVEHFHFLTHSLSRLYENIDQELRPTCEENFNNVSEVLSRVNTAYPSPTVPSVPVQSIKTEITEEEPSQTQRSTIDLISQTPKTEITDLKPSKPKKKKLTI